MKSPEQFFTKPVVVFFLATLSCFLWGSAFPCVKIGYELFAVEGTPSVLLYAGLRFLLAGALAIAFGSVGQKRLLVPKKSTFRYVLVLALFQTILQYIFYYIGLYRTTGVKASVINGTGVFLSILLACFLFRQEAFTLVKCLGCVLGFAGVLLVNVTDGLDFSFSLLGEGFLIFSTLASAIAASFSKIFARYEHPVTLSGWQFLLGGGVLTLAGLAAGGRLAPQNGWAFCMLLYLALISSVAFSLTGLLLKYNPVSKIQSYKSLTPVFGFLLSALILRENALVSLRTVSALLLVALGIFLINRYGERRFRKKSG